MFNKSLPQEAIMHASTAAVHNKPFHGVHYNALQVGGGNIREDFDPNFFTTLTSVASYWPKFGNGRQMYTNILMDEIPYAEQPFLFRENLRDEILDLEISDRTKYRYKESFDSGVVLDPDIDDFIENEICVRHEAPYALVSLHKVIRHKRIKAGEHLAILYFPLGVSDPEHPLDSIQSAIRHKISRESAN